MDLAEKPLTTADLRERPTLTVEQAGQVLGRAGAYQAVRRGEIPSVRIGHRIVVPTGALLRLLDETRAPVGA